MSTVGDQLGGRYTLSERIAAGGMGEVWKAEDAILGRTVAVKLLKAGLSDDIGFTERFRNEARLSAALTHGNIAQVYDYGENDGNSYLVMEYVPGMPLSKIISQSAPISAADTGGLISQAAAALHAAHRSGLIHRDVKPANMLVTADGVVKLTDFGIARAIGSAAMTKTGEVMGTAQYLAPEAALGRETTPLSDVYALAVVTHEMLAGERPFENDSAVALALAHVNQEPPALPSFVPPPVRAVVRAGLEKDPALRPNSAAEFGRALRQAVIDSDRMGFDPRNTPPRLPGASPGQSFPGQGAPVPASSSGPNPTGPAKTKAKAPKDNSSRPAPPASSSDGDRRPDSGPNQVGPNQAGLNQGGSNQGGSDQGGRPDRSGSPVTAPTAAGQAGQTRRTPQAAADSTPRGFVSGPNPTQHSGAGSSGPGAGISPRMWMIIGAIVGLILLIVIIVALTSGGTKVDKLSLPTDITQLFTPGGDA